MATTCIFILVLLMPLPAYAYLDPGMGSLILQAIIGTIAGGLVILKLYWYRIKKFFRPSDQDEKKR